MNPLSPPATDAPAAPLAARARSAPESGEDAGGHKRARPLTRAAIDPARENPSHEHFAQTVFPAHQTFALVGPSVATINFRNPRAIASAADLVRVVLEAGPSKRIDTRAAAHNTHCALVVDIDLSPDVQRSCACSGTSRACDECWPIVARTARSIIDTALATGFSPPVVMFSGRRGLHIYFVDRALMEITDDAVRKRVVERFSSGLDAELRRLVDVNASASRAHGMRLPYSVNSHDGDGGAGATAMCMCVDLDAFLPSHAAAPGDCARIEESVRDFDAQLERALDAGARWWGVDSTDD